jgi:GR25 family glycosyltransferase involved in LPS biosynthesis
MTDQIPRAYHGLYINLDRSEERRRNMESQLAACELQDFYARFPAVDGKTLAPSASPLKPGEVGVFLSHHHALAQASRSGQCVHILEDDALLTPHLRPVIEDAVALNLFDHYDLVFTDSVVNCHLGLMKNLRVLFESVRIPENGLLRLSNLKRMDLAQVFFASFQSYIVGAKSIPRVLALYEQEIANGIKTPVDMFIQQQVLGGKLRAACLFPFITSGRIEDVTASTIADQGERVGRPSVIVMAVLRYLFFIGRDLDYAKRILDAATTGNRKPTDLHHALIMQATEFVMSPDFEEF